MSVLVSTDPMYPRCPVTSTRMLPFVTSCSFLQSVDVTYCPFTLKACNCPTCEVSPSYTTPYEIDGAP